MTRSGEGPLSFPDDEPAPREEPTAPEEPTPTPPPPARPPARYGIVDCPTIVFAYRGGIAMRTTFHPLGNAELDAQLRRLTAGRNR